MKIKISKLRISNVFDRIPNDSIRNDDLGRVIVTKQCLYDSG